VAIGLSNIGYDVEVFERSPELRTAGAGLNLWPNAVRALYGLGLREQYDAISVKLDRYINYAPDGTVLYNKDTSDWPRKFGAPATGVYRKALNTMLTQALGEDRVRYGHELVSVRNEGDKAICEFANGAVQAGDLVVAADGIHSVARQKMVGDVKFRKNEHHAYRVRALIALADVPEADPAGQTGYYAPGSFLAVIPIGKGMAYWLGSVAGANTIDEFIGNFSSWTDTHIPRTLRITPRDSILENELHDLETRLERWVHGRVVLLGDACHAMMPDMAQGASQTLIDAQVLTDALRGRSDIDAALKEYERIRMPVAYHVVDSSRRGTFRGAKVVDPIAVRYEKEIEGFTPPTE
jgi:2-polyprenyl-6-methoxyphenol hydroxylase-like FAD-dependent oxidoreductase